MRVKLSATLVVECSEEDAKYYREHEAELIETLVMSPNVMCEVVETDEDAQETWNAN